MRTDKQLYKLFSELPDYFFDLTGIKPSARYTLTSETVKEFSRTMDGLMKPDNTEKDPAHPLLAVFQPYLQKDNATLEKEAPDYYNKIQKSSISKTVKTSLSDVFTSWMLIRFQDKSYQKVRPPKKTFPLTISFYKSKKSRHEQKEHIQRGFRILSLEGDCFKK